MSISATRSTRKRVYKNNNRQTDLILLSAKYNKILLFNDWIRVDMYRVRPIMRCAEHLQQYYYVYSVTPYRNTYYNMRYYYYVKMQMFRLIYTLTCFRFGIHKTRARRTRECIYK